MEGNGPADCSAKQGVLEIGLLLLVQVHWRRGQAPGLKY
jgi:hypothetical protein